MEQQAIKDNTLELGRLYLKLGNDDPTLVDDLNAIDVKQTQVSAVDMVERALREGHPIPQIIQKLKGCTAHGAEFLRQMATVSDEDSAKIGSILKNAVQAGKNIPEELYRLRYYRRCARLAIRKDLPAELAELLKEIEILEEAVNG